MQDSDSRNAGVNDVEDADFQFSGNDDPDLDEPVYIVFDPADIRRHMENDIVKVSSELAISTAWACILLHHYKWRMNLAIEMWLTNEEHVREEVGFLIPAEGPGADGNGHLCEICYETYEALNMFHAGCGHWYCHTCWKGYLTRGKYLELSCPHESCRAPIGEELFFVLDDDKGRDSYLSQLESSYINDHSERKWCPAAGCGCAVEIIKGSKILGVLCKCLHYFCWKKGCSEEAHAPVSCSDAMKWTQSGLDDHGTTLWKLKKTQSCPMCKTVIERTEGCLHMTCTCKHHFCWKCLGPWIEHKDFYFCEDYKKMKAQGAFKEKDSLKEQLAVRVRYYNNWDLNRQSSRRIFTELETFERKFEKLSNFKKLLFAGPFKLIAEALKEVAQCRQLLGWTYVYGYYISNFPHCKREILEHLLGQAGTQPQNFWRCAHGVLEEMLEDRTRLTELASLSRILKIYIANVLKYLEDGATEAEYEMPEASGLLKNSDGASSSSGSGGSSQP